MKNNCFILIILLILLIVYFYYSKNEAFWGGYMQVPYAGQKLKMYGRTGYDAATDNPHLIINPCAYSINP